MWKVLLTLGAFALVILAAILYGPEALLLPFIFIVGFFVVFALMALNAEIQADANPRIEEIEKPSFWLSPIYNAWLYKTDVEGWARYVTAISVIATAWFGVLAALILGASATSPGIFGGLLTGLFLIGVVAFDVGSSSYWVEQSKLRHPNASGN